MRSPICALEALTALALVAAPASAQAPVTPGLGIGLAGGYYSLAGDAFAGTDAGFGGEASVHFGLGPVWTILGGVGISSHDDASVGTLTNLRISAEPRYMLRLPSSPITPFLGVRASWARLSATFAGDDYSQTGYIIGGTGGVQVRMTPTLKFEGAVTYASASFGDWAVNGSTVTGTDASGTILALQLGVVYQRGK
jgi:hypothetical protein